MDHSSTPRYAMDGLSFFGVVATMAGWLPPVAAMLSIIWLTIQISEWGIRKWKGSK